MRWKPNEDQNKLMKTLTFITSYCIMLRGCYDSWLDSHTFRVEFSHYSFIHSHYFLCFFMLIDWLFAGFIHSFIGVLYRKDLFFALSGYASMSVCSLWRLAGLIVGGRFQWKVLNEHFAANYAAQSIFCRARPLKSWSETLVLPDAASALVLRYELCAYIKQYVLLLVKSESGHY